MDELDECATMRADSTMSWFWQDLALFLKHNNITFTEPGKVDVDLKVLTDMGPLLSFC